MGFLFTIGFLEFLGAVLILYLVTQILLPAIFPRDLEKNWAFKKRNRKPLDKVKELKDKHAMLKKDASATKEELRKTSSEVDKADKELDNLNN